MNLRDEIAKVAYELYVKRGCIDGFHLEDWCEAEGIVMECYTDVPEGTIEVAKEKKKRTTARQKEGKAKPASPKKRGVATRKKKTS